MLVELKGVTYQIPAHLPNCPESIIESDELTAVMATALLKESVEHICLDLLDEVLIIKPRGGESVLLHVVLENNGFDR